MVELHCEWFHMIFCVAVGVPDPEGVFIKDDAARHMHVTLLRIINPVDLAVRLVADEDALPVTVIELG
jgi:hypothetical protein